MGSLDISIFEDVYAPTWTPIVQEEQVESPNSVFSLLRRFVLVNSTQKVIYYSSCDGNILSSFKVAGILSMSLETALQRTWLHDGIDTI